jgi:carbonic anhydrase
MSEENLARRTFLTHAGAVSAAALQGGNKRYRANKLQLRDYSPIGERRASAQQPFAAILTCSDSRISPSPAVNAGSLWVIPAVCNVANGRVRLVAPPVVPTA